MLKVYVGSDNTLSIGPVVDTADNSVITDGTATFTIAGVVTNQAMVHTAGGVYVGVIDDATVLTPATIYDCEVTVTKGGKKLFKRVPLLAVYDEA